MSPFKLFLCAWIVLASSACSVCPQHGPESASGWREAHVDHVVMAHERPAVVGASQDCREALPDSAADQTWLLVHFRRPPIMVFRVVPVSGDRGYALGEKILINVNDCRAPVKWI